MRKERACGEECGSKRERLGCRTREAERREGGEAVEEGAMVLNAWGGQSGHSESHGVGVDKHPPPSVPEAEMLPNLLAEMRKDSKGEG